MPPTYREAVVALLRGLPEDELHAVLAAVCEDLEAADRFKAALASVGVQQAAALWREGGALWRCAQGLMPGFPCSIVWRALLERREVTILDDLRSELHRRLALTSAETTRNLLSQRIWQLDVLLEDCWDHDNVGVRMLDRSTLATLADELAAEAPIPRSETQLGHLLETVAPDAFFG